MSGLGRVLLHLIEAARVLDQFSLQFSQRVTQAISWTLADLAGLPKPGPGEVRTALAMRRGELDELDAASDRRQPLRVLEGGS